MRTNRLIHATILGAGLLMTTEALAGDAHAATNAKTHNPDTTVKQKAQGTSSKIKEDINEAILASRIRVAMMKSLKGADALRVVVQVNGTVATLSGEVEDRASEKMASESARSVQGISAVQSSVVHNPKAPHQADFEMRVRDAILKDNVRLRLLQEVGVPALGIHVTATDGAISLRGNMPNSTTRNKAVEEVRSMADVRRVEDMMTTTP